MGDWFVQHDLDDIMDRFNAAGVVAGPIYDIRDIFADPHYVARQAIVAAPDVGLRQRAHAGGGAQNGDDAGPGGPCRGTDGRGQ